jgi:hypothetical protein
MMLWRNVLTPLMASHAMGWSDLLGVRALYEAHREGRCRHVGSAKAVTRSADEICISERLRGPTGGVDHIEAGPHALTRACRSCCP